MKLEKINSTQSKLTLEMEDYVVNATYTSNDKGTELDMTCLSEGKTLATLSIKNTTLTKDKEYKVDMTLEVPDMEMKLVSNNTILFNEDVPNIDISGAKDMEEMTDEDEEKFANFIQEKMEQLGLNTTQKDNIS